MQMVIGGEFLKVVIAALERIAFVLTCPSRTAPQDALPACRHAAVLQGDTGQLLVAFRVHG
jgi:hypothetical protein